MVSARTITAARMKELARELLTVQGTPLRLDNPNVFWEFEVDRYRRRVTVRANYMQLLDMSRNQLMMMAMYRMIQP